MKKYFKLGLSAIVPFAIIGIVGGWLYRTFNNLMLFVLPASWGWNWWYVPIFIVVIFILLFLLGFALGAILSKFKLARWAKRTFDKIIDKVPVINKFYSFGLEISDALIADGKLDGKIKVVGFDWNEWIVCYGLLTSDKNHFIASATVPNPTNGFLFQVKPEHYWEVNMTIDEYLKTVTSMGKLGKRKWLNRVMQSVK